MRALVFAISIFGLVGCTATTVTYERTIEQSGLVMPPGGPIGGRTLESGEVALEATYRGSAFFSSDYSRYEGENGNIVLNHMARGRLGIGNSLGQLGFSLAYANGSLGDAIADDVRVDDEIEDQHALTFAMDSRFRLTQWEGGRYKLGLLLEGGLSKLPYQRSIYEQVFVETTTYGWWSEPTTKSQVLGSRLSFEQDFSLVPQFAGGLYGEAQLNDELAIVGGAMMQTFPVFFGSKVVTETCEFSSTAIDCYGEDPDDISPWDWSGLTTLFASVSYRINRLEVIGQLYGHPLGMGSESNESSPLGGELTLRLVFD